MRVVCQQNICRIQESLSHIEFVGNNAKFISEDEVEVNGEIYRADKFIIATGSSTFIPQIEGIDKVDYLTNIEVLQLNELPKSMQILGGGALGIEFAQMFSRFGTKVCLLQQEESQTHLVQDCKNSGLILGREEKLLLMTK